MSIDERQRIEDNLSRPQGAHTPPPNQEVVKAPSHLPLPVGTQLLLDAQLGEALKMMRDYAEWVHHPRSAMEECLDVGNTLARLMTASAAVATVAAQLQNGEPETRHRVIVEYIEGPAAPKPSIAPAYGREGGEGVAKSRKRIKAGDA